MKASRLIFRRYALRCPSCRSAKLVAVMRVRAKQITAGTEELSFVELRLIQYTLNEGCECALPVFINEEGEAFDNFRLQILGRIALDEEKQL